MPLPKPNTGESQDDFISRCMSDDTAQEEFPDQEQRLGVCFSQWRAEHGGEPPTRGLDSMERKQLRVEIKDAEKGIVQAAFAKLEAKDYDDDWTLSGAFGEQKVRVSAYGHGSWMGELPIGRGTIREENGEAVADLQFFVSTQHGREHFEVIKEMGDLQEWSYGFDVLETGELTEELREKGVRRVLKKLKVHEVSPVLLGAGIGTRTLAVKALEDLLRVVPASRWSISVETETKGDGTEEADVSADAAAEEAARAEAETRAAEEIKAREAEALQAEFRQEEERLTRNMRKSGRR